MSGITGKGQRDPGSHADVHDEAMTGPPGTGQFRLCKCLECGTVTRHRRAESCGDHLCPKCGAAMVRGD